MDLIIVAELDATDSVSTRMFQTLSAGKTKQFGAPGMRTLLGVAAAATGACAATATTAPSVSNARIGRDLGMAQIVGQAGESRKRASCPDRNVLFPQHSGAQRNAGVHPCVQAASGRLLFWEAR